jgi:hypothetical protein
MQPFYFPVLPTSLLWQITVLHCKTIVPVVTASGNPYLYPLMPPRFEVFFVTPLQLIFAGRSIKSDQVLNNYLSNYQQVNKFYYLNGL